MSDQPIDLQREIDRRRTFAIISHPDAGKTTMTEKLLLYGGALHIAGAVKSRKSARHAVSDWMEMEKEKGISITSSVLQFDYKGCRVNLLDTPGHADFSEDTYRTLSAVDGAIMLIDAAKGVEARTRRLFEVCRMRNLPILTFVNKMDRPTLDPLDLMDDVGTSLNVGTVALNWPIGSADTFTGVLDRRNDEALLFDHAERGSMQVPTRSTTLDDPEIRARIGDDAHDDLIESAELIAEAGDPWDLERFLAGELTPFFFGSAMTNFGVGPFLDALVDLTPPPQPRASISGTRAPTDENFSAFVFKIQANMNPRHRDRIAFMRVVSGAFERGMNATLARTGRSIRLAKPHSFMASERALVESAVAGDIVGLYDSGELRIGDTLHAGPEVRYQSIPRFAPEFFARVRLKDPTRRKHLKTGLMQLSHEGTIQLFQAKYADVEPYVGAVGMLQFEVLKVRLKNEYRVEVALDPAPFHAARWIGGDQAGQDWLDARSDYLVVYDRNEAPVLLAQTAWSLQYALQEAPGLELFDVSPL